jgi:hypothetical protein
MSEIDELLKIFRDPTASGKIRFQAMERLQQLGIIPDLNETIQAVHDLVKEEKPC